MNGQKTSLKASKWPRKVRTQKTVDKKIAKMESRVELVEEMGGHRCPLRSICIGRGGRGEGRQQKEFGGDFSISIEIRGIL
jgi:hypothetical protein